MQRTTSATSEAATGCSDARKKSKDRRVRRMRVTFVSVGACFRDYSAPPMEMRKGVKYSLLSSAQPRAAAMPSRTEEPFREQGEGPVSLTPAAYVAL